MTEYLELSFHNLSDRQQEAVIALLAENCFEGFLEEDSCLKAYIPHDLYNAKEIANILSTLQLTYHATSIPPLNWNKEWENNFEPVTIKSKIPGHPAIGIRAAFHKPLPGVIFDVVITPKMSFGTGHHATTSMMVEKMTDLDFEGKSVLDFGTGTGILAIVAERLGAEIIIAIDNDDQCIENATENFESNNCSRISLVKGSVAGIGDKFDIILANIIKSVILDNLPVMAMQLNEGGSVLLSGLLNKDKADILAAAGDCNLKLIAESERDNWICLQMQ